MPWVKIDDHMAEHPKIVAVGPLAAWLHICALQYCSRNLTDGFIPLRAVPMLANFEDWGGDGVDPLELAVRLRLEGVWEGVEGGYQIHDYLEYQPSREQVLADREAAKRRMRAIRSPEVRANNERSSDSPYPVPDPVPKEATTAVVATAVAARPRPHVELVEHSEGARVVLEEWRRAHGKRSPPKLNPTQAQRLENAVVDLGVERLCEAARYSAEKGLAEFHKCVTSAYTKRKLDEDRTAEPVVRPVGTARGAGRDSRNPRDYFKTAAQR